RKGFGKDYIQDTIDCVEGVWSAANDEVENDQLKWFHDVLSEYFTHIGDSDQIVYELGKKFALIVSSKQLNTCVNASKSIPYHRLDSSKSDISFDDFYKLVR